MTERMVASSTKLLAQPPLSEVAYHFAHLRRSPFHLHFLTAILQRCPRQGRTLEVGVETGLSAIWLSLRGLCAEGIGANPPLLERARQANSLLGGIAEFRPGDPFALYQPDAPRYHVLHHQNLLERCTAPQVRALLAQQVALADWVLFTVPSVYCSQEPAQGGARLLPLEEWKHLLRDFDVVELAYTGDPPDGERDHIFCILRGQPVTPELRARMTVTPYPDGISAIVHTRNEERHIADCLQSLVGWTEEILVCDMESEDRTVEIARRFTDHILAHPRIANFDRSRNVSAMRARYRWVFYLDADERVPPGLGPALRHLIATEGESFSGALIPFRHYFSGHWMQCLYPGYTAPRLLKNGEFVFNTRLHAGAQVEGRILAFPAQDPNLALTHYSFDSLSHYLEKLNRYTDGEAANMHRDGQTFHWQSAMRHFVHDLKTYYDQMGAYQDGVHGFLYSFLSAFYRFEQHAKLYERRFREQTLLPQEEAVPPSAEALLEFALAVARERPQPQASPIRVDAGSPEAATVVWSGPLSDPSAYGEESRQFLFGLEEAGMQVAAQRLPWSGNLAPLTEAEIARLTTLLERPAQPGFLQVIQTFPPHAVRHPEAGLVALRTMFETDRLPPDWVRACNQMEAVWVPSEFNRQTFTSAGVEPGRLAVLPGCLDAPRYQEPGEPTDLSREIAADPRFTFLTVFDWTRHKGWDVLLRGFLEAFEGKENVALVLKVWSTLGYPPEVLQEQAAAFVRETLGHDLLADPRIRFVFTRFTQAELIALYKACDAFVLPSRGEGWGRPYMEALACGLPVLGTNWSGNTAFMTPENSALLDCEVVPVPEIGWREIPTYKGHRWAEPNAVQLVAQLRGMVEEPGEARARAAQGQEEILARYDRRVVGRQLAAEIARLQETHRAHPVGLPGEVPQSPPVSGFVIARKRATKRSPHTPPAASTPSPTLSPPMSLRWEGMFFAWHSLAHVNRELCRGLLASGQVEVSLVPLEPIPAHPQSEALFAPLAARCFAPLSKPAEVHVRHFFPPRLEPPGEGHFVLIQPWEYGYLPSRWVPAIQEHVSEVWCYSRYVQEVYRASGIPEEKTAVIPLGVDTRTFSPHAPPYIFTTEPGASALAEGRGQERFVFLFCGGTLHRKGIDILLDAYLKAFSAYDEVCLVIKDTGTETVYQGQNARERILSLVDDPTRAPIVYLEEDLSAHQLAGVYTACDCLVQPYRGEGFCLPALEAMACGLPVLVPEGGPTDDFVDETVGWRLAAERRPYPSGRIGDWDCVGPPWGFEVASETLARQMRKVCADRAAVREKGQRAVERVQAHWTWEHAVAAMQVRLAALRERPAPERRRLRPLPAVEEALPSPGVPETASPPLPEARAETVTKAPLGEDRRVSSRRKPAASKAEATPARTQPLRALPTISLCMIVKNEERVLGDCLKSVRPFVDEIVIVDTGSTDKTVEIAKAAGAKVHHFPWCDDFSAARNVSLSHATGEWLFWMDADDTLPEECGKRLHELALLAEDRVTGYLLQVHIPPAPGESGFTIVDHVKLFRNLPGIRFEGRIHEQILEAIYRTGGTVERSDLYVIHSGYDYSPEGQRLKRERDLRILQLELAERPNHPFVHFNIGMTYHHLRRFPEAIAALERCLELSQPHESTVRKVYAMLANCHLEEGNLPRAKARLEEGLALTPYDPELLFRAGIIYRELGDFAAAERSYLTLLTRREVGHIDSLDVSMTGFKAQHNLALIYQDMGRYAEAEAQWRAALAQHPTFVPSWMGLGDLYLRQRRFDDMQAVASELAKFAPEQATLLRKEMLRAYSR